MKDKDWIRYRSYYSVVILNLSDINQLVDIHNTKQSNIILKRHMLPSISNPINNS